MISGDVVLTIIAPAKGNLIELKLVGKEEFTEYGFDDDKSSYDNTFTSQSLTIKLPFDGILPPGIYRYPFSL